MDSKKIIREAFNRHIDATQGTMGSILEEIERGATMLIKAVENGGRLFVCGNGGSAADSQHLAAEWVCRYKKERPPLPAIALTVDTSAITAIGNDYGFQNAFSRQIEALGKKGDVLVALTTSGASKNILNAMVQAKRNGLSVITLTGAKGKNVRDADLLIVVPSEETARIQEMHELIYHAWCECIDALYSTPKTAQ